MPRQLAVFHQMRLAQFLTWERPLLTIYAADLDAADHVAATS